MAKKAKILSFAQAKNASRQRRVQSADSNRPSRSYGADRSSRTSRISRNSRSFDPLQMTSSKRFDRQRDLDEQEGLEFIEEFDEDSNTDARNDARRSSQRARDERRKKRSKERAKRMYSRQFAADEGASVENAPRAALYKGRMGSKQKKAARMQGSLPRFSLPSFFSTGRVRDKASGFVANSSVSPLSLKVLTAVACLVLACLFLYTPAQQYYCSQRENARLTTEYATIENRNQALDVQNDILVSEAGIEDTVRQRFGYVKAGESTGIVVGLSEETTSSLRDSEKIEANVLSSSVKAPQEWYTPLLDALFGVE